MQLDEAIALIKAELAKAGVDYRYIQPEIIEDSALDLIASETGVPRVKPPSHQKPDLKLV